MEKLKKFTERLNGVQYRKIPEEVIKEAERNGIVIVSGASDDLCELEGAVYDEFGCYDGGTAYIDEEGRLYNQKRTEQAFKYITAKWCEDGEDGFTWTYDTDIPHETFEMYDGEEKYCKGFVFYKKSLRTDGNYNENTEKLLRLVKENPSLPVVPMVDILEQYNKLNSENIALREKFITAVKDVAERIKMAFYYEFEEIIRAYTPRHNGKVERSHRTDQESFYNYLTYSTIDELREKMAEWLIRYNNRPHSSLRNREGKRVWLTPLQKREELLEDYRKNGFKDDMDNVIKIRFIKKKAA